jgi:acyl-CoA synthetase (AMP-forming)/AMP-acid ligase II
MVCATRVHDLLAHAAERFPTRRVFESATEALTYAELDRDSAGGTAFLEGHGIGRGDRVALALEPSADYLRAYFAILRAGAVVVPLHPGSGARYFEQVATHAEVRAAFLSGEDTSAVDIVAAAVPDVRLVVWSDLAHATRFPSEAGALSCWNATPRGDARVETEDLAALFYTSGSSGAAKAVMLSHRNLTANTASVLDYLPIDEHERAGLLLPFCYAYGDSVLRTHVTRGACMVRLPPVMEPRASVTALRDGGCTSLPAVSIAFNLLLLDDEFRAATLPTMRYLTHAGGPAHPRMVAELRRRFVNAPLYCMYGQTEAGPRLAYLPPEQLMTKSGSIGRPVPGVELAVVDADGRTVADGEEGELVARGPNIMAGYWKDPERTEKVLEGGRLRTGDLARRDSDGFFYIVGRRDDMIKAGSHRVDPCEIEQVVETVPGVLACAVVGRVDEFTGERIVAYVTATDRQNDPTRAIFIACRALPEYKRPTQVHVVDEIPRSPTGKVLRKQLRS